MLAISIVQKYWNYKNDTYLNNRNGPINPIKTDKEKQETKSAVSRTMRALLLLRATLRTSGKLDEVEAFLVCFFFLASLKDRSFFSIFSIS